MKLFKKGNTEYVAVDADLWYETNEIISNMLDSVGCEFCSAATIQAMFNREEGCCQHYNLMLDAKVNQGRESDQLRVDDDTEDYFED